MQKKKDGTIIASLTEVKNKTGDIFSLVDEFGEVVLTSYNKPKYKIVKMSVGSMLDVEPEESKQEKTEPKEEQKPDKKSGIKRVADTVKNIARIPTPSATQAATPEPIETAAPEPVAEETPAAEPATVQPTMITVELMQSMSDMTGWDRNSDGEQKYIKAIQMPLQ